MNVISAKRNGAPWNAQVKWWFAEEHFTNVLELALAHTKKNKKKAANFGKKAQKKQLQNFVLVSQNHAGEWYHRWWSLDGLVGGLALI